MVVMTDDEIKTSPFHMRSWWQCNIISFVQFFYKDYLRKTHDRLDVFDKDFNGPLEQENRRLKEVILSKAIIDNLP